MQAITLAGTLTWKKDKKEKKSPLSRVIPVLAIGVVVIGFVVYFVMAGSPAGPSSKLLTCSELSYGVFSAETYNAAGSASAINYTETTGTTFVTTTNVAAPIGHSFSSVTDDGAVSGFVDYGQEEFCTYLNSTAG
jgi:hypothetical protein